MFSGCSTIEAPGGGWHQAQTGGRLAPVLSVIFEFWSDLVRSSLSKWRSSMKKRIEAALIYIEYILEYMGKRRFLKIQTLTEMLWPFISSQKLWCPGGTQRAWRVCRSPGHRVGLPKKFLGFAESVTMEIPLNLRGLCMKYKLWRRCESESFGESAFALSMYLIIVFWAMTSRAAISGISI